MRLPDSFSFRQRPTGLVKRLLHLPVWLYRARLGFLLGDRFLLVTHVGRSSGRHHQTPVEVVVHDRDAGEYLVCSGTGPQADWYRNLQVTPAPEVQVGTRRWCPHQRLLAADEAAEAFHRYERAHPATARRLLQSMGNAYDGTDAGRVAMMADMPMVAFSETAVDPDAT
jgi:deazaflavin-dependent oxidoreductase (nitroreductase family)